MFDVNETPSKSGLETDSRYTLAQKRGFKFLLFLVGRLQNILYYKPIYSTTNYRRQYFGERY